MTTPPLDAALPPGEIFARALADTTSAKVQLTRSICKRSFAEFAKLAWPIIDPATPIVWGKAMGAMCDALQAVTEGKINRLLINVPPGLAKTALVNVLWPAWEWGPRQSPHFRYIAASYELGLSTHAMDRCRDVLKSTWYQTHWPMRFSETMGEKTFYGNVHTGWRKASSVGGALTGYRGHRFIMDDPHDPKRANSAVELAIALDWVTQVVPTRFCDPNKPVYVVIMQRLSPGDISGHLMATANDAWTKLILPMEYDQSMHCKVPEIGFEDWRTEPDQLLFPERYSREAVDALKRDMMAKGGMYAVAGQLQQRPIPREGGLFKGEPQFSDQAPSPQHGIMVRAWDLAATHNGGDYTVGTLMQLHDNKVFVLDVVRKQGSSFEIRELIRATAARDGLHCPISLPQDPGQAGLHQKADLAALLGGYPVHFSTESGAKEDRAIPIAAQWEAGNVVVMRRPWTALWCGRIGLFPGDGKDETDSMSRGYAYLLSKSTQGSRISMTAGWCVSTDDPD